ncbi:MAG: DNA polymerase Y family protein [Proteobacteria bacterium]|uniref:DNA polymerase Y family protein n=1 Tax=Aquabacterium sp. TaxID=1872578 RepID=UPI0035C71E17|nr:DNA polymerase Y family protein [Pseudomonadota bacterium]
MKSLSTMRHWIALLPGWAPDAGQPGGDTAEPPPGPSLQAQLGWWALQFTPRVACLEDAVVLEVSASERLFGGAQALRERVWQGATRLVAGMAADGDGAGDAALNAAPLRMAHAPTALGALALARGVMLRTPRQADEAHGARRIQATEGWLDALRRLPLQTLSEVARHAPTLAPLGCRTLGDVRALPRDGLSRRFGAALVQALDRAWGDQAEVFDWLSLPPTFDVQLELPARTDTAAGLQPAFEHLLRALCAWLAGHQAGTELLELRWCHAWSRHGDTRWQTWPVRLASPVRDASRLRRLLGEHLQRLRLASPVTDVGLRVHSLVALRADSEELFPCAPGSALATNEPLTVAARRTQHEALLALLERLSVRLGPQRVQQALPCEDQRGSQSQHWVAALPRVQALGLAPGWPARASGAGAPGGWGGLPQPAWWLPEPLPLAMDTRCAPREQPIYQGPLRLLAGPHRIEAGWWDVRDHAPAEARDHHLASSPRAGLLWVFRARHAPQDGHSPWFLQGFFA